MAKEISAKGGSASGGKRNTPRDLFLHLLAVVTLYWSSISFVALIWQFINRLFPDVMNQFVLYYNSQLIRFLISALIIVFPVFLLVSWGLNKIYAKEAVVRESKIRKWLIYLTLFIAALVIIVDLVTVINTFLGGEITARFILKALSVLVVAGIIFGYYLDDVRRKTPTKSAKYFAWLASVIILAAIVYAFFIVGSPQTARLIEFDQQKVNDLAGIQSQIVFYWQGKEMLPATLSDLNDPISGYKAPIDPQFGAPYEYYIDDAMNLSFQLCANFNKASSASDMLNTPMPIAGVPESYNQNWNHDAGKVCFSRTIDRQLYPPFSKTKQ